MRALPWLLALGLLAGCVEEDPVTPAAGTAAPSAPVPEAAAAPSTEPAPAAPARDAAPAPRSEPLAYEGRTGRWACLPSGPTSCSGRSLGVEGENAVFIVPHVGVTRVAGALSWTAASPATERLVLRLGVFTPCGDGCSAWEEVARLEGASPLPLDEAAPPVPPGGALGLWVEHEVRAPPPLVGHASLDQAFAFEGEATVLQ